MKQSEIKVGGVYNNGKKAARRVAAIKSRWYADYVSYTVVQGPLRWGSPQSSCTLKTFAAWAKGTGRLK